MSEFEIRNPSVRRLFVGLDHATGSCRTIWDALALPLIRVPACPQRRPINSYVAAARHFALGDTAIYGLLRLIKSTLIAQYLGLGVIDDVWITAETGSLRPPQRA